jgi:hypothetical protein
MKTVLQPKPSTRAALLLILSACDGPRPAQAPVKHTSPIATTEPMHVEIAIATAAPVAPLKPAAPARPAIETLDFFAGLGSRDGTGGLHVATMTMAFADSDTDRARDELGSGGRIGAKNAWEGERERVFAAFHRRRADFYACAKGLPKRQNVKGTMTVELTLTDDGRPEALHVHGIDATMERCVEAVVTKMRFASPQIAQRLQVRFPIVFDVQ